MSDIIISHKFTCENLNRISKISNCDVDKPYMLFQHVQILNESHPIKQSVGLT